METTGHPAASYQLGQVHSLRMALLNLHKTLLNYEKKRYERKVGKILAAGEWFKMVIGESSFAWLRPLSEFIVGMDEFLDSKEPKNNQSLEDMLKYAKRLLSALPEKNKFEREYFKAIQNDPNVAVAHGQVQTVLKKLVGDNQYK